MFLELTKVIYHVTRRFISEVSFVYIAFTLTFTVVDYTYIFNELKILHLKDY